MNKTRLFYLALSHPLLFHSSYLSSFRRHRNENLHIRTVSRDSSDLFFFLCEEKKFRKKWNLEIMFPFFLYSLVFQFRMEMIWDRDYELCLTLVTDIRETVLMDDK